MESASVTDSPVLARPSSLLASGAGWRRRAKDRLMTGLIAGAFALAMIPLISLVWEVTKRGIPGLSLAFFTEDARGVVGEGGGASHAIIGTLVITGVAAAISVPIGIMGAIYLNEYGQGRLRRALTFFVDVMTGIPSIVFAPRPALLTGSVEVTPEGRSAIVCLPSSVALRSVAIISTESATEPITPRRMPGPKKSSKSA